MRARFSGGQANLAGKATLGLCIALSVGFLLSWIPETGNFLRDFFAIQVGKPNYWALLTHPFVHSGDGQRAAWFLFSVLWLYGMGRQLEATDGAKGLFTVFFAGAVLHGATAWVVFATMVGRGPWYTPFMAISFLTVFVAARSPNQIVSLFGVLPVSMKVVAIGTAVLDVLYIGSGMPIIGVLVCIPLALAWVWGSGIVKLPRSSKTAEKKQNVEFDEFMGKVRKREKDREEQERLRRLFEGSLGDDPKIEP